MNPYEILGVDRDADDDTIKRAYRRASSAAHPDREGGSTEEQQRVNDAYAILSDPDKRAEFNATGKVSGDDLRAQAMGMAVSIFLQKLDDPWVFDPIKSGVEHLQGLQGEQHAVGVRLLGRMQAGAQHALVVDATVLVEAGILGRQPDGLCLTGISHSPETRRRLIAARIPINHA